MPVYGTWIYAMSPSLGSMKTYGGPNIDAISPAMARQYCEENGLGYCHIGDVLVCEIPCKPGTYEPDFDNKIEYNEGNN